MKKIDWKLFFKSLFSRNMMLCLFLNVVNTYGWNIIRTVRTMIGKDNLGMTASLIGVAATVFALSSIVVRSSSGAVLDKFRKNINKVLSIYFVARIFIWLLFLVANSPVMYFAIFVLDGAINAFIGAALPATVGMCVDKSIMGSSYAIYMGLATVLTGTSRTVAMSMYKNYGFRVPVLIACGLALVGAVLCFLLDSKKMCAIDTPNKAAKPQKKKGLAGIFDGLYVKLIPMCFISAIPIIMFTCQSSFSQLWLPESGFSFMGIDAVGATINGFIVILVGFMCDIVSPSILTMVSMAGFTVFPLLMGLAKTQAVYSTALWIYYLTKFYHIPPRIAGMKAVKKSELGAFSATLCLAFDVYNLISTTILGFSVDKLGFQGTMLALSGLGAISLVAFIIIDRTVLKKIREESAQPELEAAPAPEAT